MKVIGCTDRNVVHLEKCMHVSEIKNPIEFETLKEAIQQGFELLECCDGMRKRLFEKGFVISGPKMDTEIFSREVYYPEESMS